MSEPDDWAEAFLESLGFPKATKHSRLDADGKMPPLTAEEREELWREWRESEMDRLRSLEKAHNTFVA